MPNNRSIVFHDLPVGARFRVRPGSRARIPIKTGEVLVKVDGVKFRENAFLAYNARTLNDDKPVKIPIKTIVVAE